MHFVEISRQGGSGKGSRPSFRVGSSSSYRFVGANAYQLLTRAADPSFRADIFATLDAAQGAGLKVLRIWAFADGPDEWNATQPSAGVYEERVLHALDWILSLCYQRSLHVILVLTNYWPDYGGLQQYARWGMGLLPKAPVKPEAFYICSKAQQLFGQYVEMLVTRRNTVSGVAYRDDPTIMAWEVVNEPRCEASSGVDPGCMRRWLASVAGSIRALDHRHLVTCGLDGFLGTSHRDVMHANPYDTSPHGPLDWAVDSEPFDFLSFHMYPDHWLPAGSTARQVKRFIHNWVEAHSTLAGRLGKPVVLSEFGARRVVCCRATQDHLRPAAACFSMTRPQLYLQVLSEAFGELPDANTLMRRASSIKETGMAAPSSAQARDRQQQQLAPAPAGPDDKVSQPQQTEVQESVIGKGSETGGASQGDGRLSSLLRHACCLRPAVVRHAPHFERDSHSMRARPVPPAASTSGQEEGAALDGVLFWNLAAPSYEDYDGFTLYLEAGHPSQSCIAGGQLAPEDEATCTVIQRYTEHLNKSLL